MSESFDSNEIQDIILDNMDMMVDDGEYFDVELTALAQIFRKIDTCDGIDDKRRLVIRRAAYILSLITNRQPFSGANRRTAYSTAMYYLRKNSLNIPLNTLQEEKAIFDLLDKTKRKMSIDPSICVEVESFLVDRVSEYIQARRIY